GQAMLAADRERHCITAMRMMRKSHLAWLVVTTVVIGSLLLTLPIRPEHETGETEETEDARFDQPDAALLSDVGRRRPTDGRTDVARFYEGAALQMSSLARFSSAIGRDIPASQPASRVWLSG